MHHGAWFRTAFGTALTFTFLGQGVAACGQASGNPSGSSGGSASGSPAAGELPTSGASGASTIGGAAGAAAGGAAGAAGDVEACPEAPELKVVGGTLTELDFVPTLAGKPFVLGEPNAMAGGQVSPLNSRFYVSELSLVAADGALVPADLVTSSRTPEPYGVHLVNFEDPESTSVRVLAPPGTYEGFKFTVGLNDACNRGGFSRNAPLSANSQMIWPHVAGYLFLRYEASWTPGTDGAAAPPPSMIHMGGQVGSVFAPQATVAGPLTVPAMGAVNRKVRVSFDEIFSGASSSEDVSGMPGPFQTPEVIAGERLRRAVPTLDIFQLDAP